MNNSKIAGVWVKARKKPVVIDAIQYTGKNGFFIEQASESIKESPVLEPSPQSPGGQYLQIITLEGTMTAVPGDWIIKGINGEFYPCKPDIFEKTYEPVTDEPTDELNHRMNQAMPSESQPVSLLEVEDLQEQVRKHISSHDFFDWDEALTEEEMTYLENLLLTFAPIFQPGSIGFEKTVKPYLQQPIPVNQDSYWQKLAKAAEQLLFRIAERRPVPDPYSSTEQKLYNQWQQLKSSPSPIPVQEGLKWDGGVKELTDIRNKLYDNLPVKFFGDSSEAWDLLQIIKQHIKELDEYCERVKKVYKRVEPADEKEKP